MMRALGAEVVLIDQLPASKPGQVSGGDLALVEEAAQRITKERQLFRADQFHLESSSRPLSAHGLEILEQAAGRIDAFCDYAVRAARLEAAPRRSRSMTLLFSATSWNLQKRRCWQAKQ